MSDDNITLCTPYSGDAEEPCAKKLRVATEHTSLKVHSEPADGPNEYVSADNESSLTRKNGANPNIKEGCKDVGFTSNSFIGPLCQQESVDRKTVEIEDELDKFYKELEQIAPEDVDSIDDCNADKDANAQKQHSPVLQQEIQCDFVQSVWHHEPHSGQLLQNKPQTLEHLQPYSHYWDACLSPSQRSNSPYCGVTHTRSQRFLHQSPSPFLPPPPPRMVPYSLCDYGSRHNFRDQNQETFRWENNPTNSSHTNQGDKHFAHQDPYETVPNEIGCNGSYGSQLRCSQSHGKNSSFCQRNSEEYKFYQQAHTPPGQTADPYSFKLILMRGAPGSGKSTLARCVKKGLPS